MRVVADDALEDGVVETGQAVEGHHLVALLGEGGRLALVRLRVEVGVGVGK